MPFPKKSEMSPEEWEAQVAKRNASRIANKAAGTSTRKRARRLVDSLEMTAEFDSPSIAEQDQTLEHLATLAVADGLMRLPPPDDVLSKDEIEAIYAVALAQADKERKEARRKVIMDQALEEARRGAGLIEPKTEREKWLDELVDVTIRLPALRQPGSSQISPADPIIIDQQIFHNGATRRVRRAVAQHLMSLMWENRKHAAQVEGRSRHYFDEGIGKIVYMGGPAATGFGQPGVTFDGLHKRPA